MMVSLFRNISFDTGISVNFLTKKQQVRTNINANASDESEEEIEEIWQDIEMIKGLLKLTDIKDFDKLNVSDYYRLL